MNKSMIKIHQLIINNLLDFFNTSHKKAIVYLPAGFGENYIIKSIVSNLLNNKTIMILSPFKMIVEQLYEIINTDNNTSQENVNLLITTFKSVENNVSILKNYEIVICLSISFIDFHKINFCENNKIIGFSDTKESSNSYFFDAITIYNYYQNELDIEPINNASFMKNYVLLLLSKLNYKNIQLGDHLSDIAFIPDIIAEYNSKLTIFEIKLYRNLYNSSSLLNSIREKYSNLNNKYDVIIIMTCKIDEKVKQQFYNLYNIIIWDICNLIYLNQDNNQLIDSLTNYLSFSIKGIPPIKPLGIYLQNPSIVINDLNKGNYLKNLLKTCKPGKDNNSHKQYESICNQIINYLFGTEFLKFIKQYNTKNMFQIDLLCSLKGTTELWKFLINFYKTKFVVFEYKNYNEKISQNEVYITEKYLYPIALRNVAFLISRKGFDDNAKKAALGCLKENGKLIVELKDEDLIQMIDKKNNGEEPSDYVLDLIENFLMSIDK